MFEQEKGTSGTDFWTSAGEAATTVGGLVGDVMGVLPGLSLNLSPAIPGAGPVTFASDGISAGADFVGGLGKVVAFDEEGNWDPNFGGFGDMVNGLASGVEAAGVETGAVGSLVGGGAQALFNGLEAKENHDLMVDETDPMKRAEHEHNMWGAAGDATLGGMHGLLGAFCKPGDIALSAFELAADSAGTLAGMIDEDAAFGAGDVMGGILDGALPEEDDSYTNRVRRALGPDTVLGTVGGAAATPVEAALAPFRILNEMSSASVNTIGNMIDSNDTRDTYLDLNRAMGDGVDWMAGSAATAVHSAGSAIGAGIDALIPSTPQQALSRHALFGGMF